jgi:hypothetical protein
MDCSENVYQQRGLNSTPNFHYLGVFQYAMLPLPIEIVKGALVMTF